MKNCRLIIISMAFWGLFLVVSTAQAQTYKWTDEHSRIFFTDDLSKVPEKYRKSVVHIGELERSQSKNGGWNTIRTDQHTRNSSRGSNHKKPLIWLRNWSERDMRYRTNGPRT